MLEFNFLVLFCASIVPLLVGFVWYNPRMFGKIWMESVGIEENASSNTRLFKIFALTFVLSYIYAIALQFQVIHQLHFQSMFLNEIGFKEGQGTAFQDFKFIMTKYGDNFRTFKHGAFHGFLNSLFIVLPIVAINAIFEMKSWKYILINIGFWMISMILMGGIICQFT